MEGKDMGHEPSMRERMPAARQRGWDIPHRVARSSGTKGERGKHGARKRFKQSFNLYHIRQLSRFSGKSVEVSCAFAWPPHPPLEYS